MPLFILLLPLGGVLVWAVVVFNGLVHLRNRAHGAWADIDVQLKRRHDLVQNLVETVKGYMSHERGTLESVVRARTQAAGALDLGSPKQAGVAETLLGKKITGLFALVEDYPDLKSSETFQDLHRALVDLENDLQQARRYYNAVVRDFNTRIQSFPHMMVARPFGFAEREFFQLDSPDEARVPKVDLEAAP